MNRQQRRANGPAPKTSDISEINSLLVDAFDQINRFLFDIGAPSNVVDAVDTISTHCAVSLRLMAKTPPSVIRSETTTFAIGQYMAGKEEMV
jgi:hypothetical protein